jgi:methylated-DNA-[protein]-cysteine S-methyltransferase
MTYFDTMQTPIGRLLLTATEAGLSGLFMEKHLYGPESYVGWIEDSVRLAETKRQLQRYFDGGLREFDLPLDLHGTPFQIEVWNALREIRFGATWSYRDLAAHIGRPTAVRAVGAANGRNPVSIIVPCHRVIGSDGSLTGYGGGLPRKQFLLEHEARVLGRSPRVQCELELGAPAPCCSTSAGTR